MCHWATFAALFLVVVYKSLYADKWQMGGGWGRHVPTSGGAMVTKKSPHTHIITYPSANVIVVRGFNGIILRSEQLTLRREAKIREKEGRRGPFDLHTHI